MLKPLKGKKKKAKREPKCIVVATNNEDYMFGAHSKIFVVLTF